MLQTHLRSVSSTFDRRLFDGKFIVEEGLGSCMDVHSRSRVYTFKDEGATLVLKHYVHGGLLAPLLADYYFWCGLERARMWREFNILERLVRLRMPVPVPYAVRVERNGLFYRGQLVTRHLDPGGPRWPSLAEVLAERKLEHEEWRTLGASIRRFHNADLCHGDLNAHNILLPPKNSKTATERVYLVDFDQAYFVEDREKTKKSLSWWRNGNLDHLQRSLCNLGVRKKTRPFTIGNWSSFTAGYLDS